MSVRLERACVRLITSSSVESIVISPPSSRLELLDERRRRRGGRPRRSLAMIFAPWSAFELLGLRRVEPLRLAGELAELLLRGADALDLLVGDLERLEQRVLGNLVGAGLDHRQAFLRADDDQIEVVAALHRGERRVDDELPVDLGDAHGADRAEERHRREHERGRGAVDARGCRAPVMRSADSTVQMTCTSFVKPFGQSGRIGRSIIRAVRIARSVGRPSRLKKPPGIFPAAYIRSSTSTVSGKKSAPSRASVRPVRGRQDHRVATADDDRAVGLLGELAGLHRDFRVADRDGDTRVQRRIQFHLLSPRDGGGGLRQRPRALPQTSTGVSRARPGVYRRRPSSLINVL